MMSTSVSMMKPYCDYDYDNECIIFFDAEDCSEEEKKRGISWLSNTSKTKDNDIGKIPFYPRLKKSSKRKKSSLNDVVNASRSANKQQPRQAAILQSFIPISKETPIHPLTVPKVINSLAKSRSKSVSKETKVIKLKDKLTKYQVSPTYNPQIPRLDKSKINTSKIPPMANVSFLPSQSKPKRSRTVPISGYQHASPPKARSISPLQMKPQYIMPYGAVPVAGGHINGHYLYPQPQMVYTTTVPPQAMHPRPQLHPQLGLAQNAAIYSPQQFYRR